MENKAITRYIPEDVLASKADVLAKVAKFKITSKVKALEADAMFTTLHQIRKDIETRFKKVKDPLNASLKELRALEAEGTNDIILAESNLKRELQSFQLTEAAKERERIAAYEEKVASAVDNGKAVPAPPKESVLASMSSTTFTRKDVEIDKIGRAHV